MNLRLARQLQSRDYPVRLLTLFKRPWFEPLDPFGLDVVRLNMRGWNKPLAVLRLLPWVRQADIVIGGVEDAATNYGWLAATLGGKPFIAWTHTSLSEHIQRIQRLDRWISLQVRRRLRWMVFPSHGALESMQQVLGETHHQRTHWRIIENFLDPLPTPSPQPPDLQLFSKPVVLGIGRLSAEKAFDRLIRAHAVLRARGFDHHLIILGEGPLRQMLESEAQRLGVGETVFLPGHVHNVADWLAHATVFALSSRYEGFGLVLLEALACGTPAVAMDCPSGPREILALGQAGILVPEGDEVAFQEALARLLSSPKLRAHYAQAGRERARHYAPERILPQWEALLAEIAASG